MILTVEPDELEISWRSIEGRRYQIERSTDLASWTDLETVTASTSTTTFADTDADEDSPRYFYRVRLL